MKKIIKTICIFFMAVAFIPYIFGAIVFNEMMESIDINEAERI